MLQRLSEQIEDLYAPNLQGQLAFSKYGEKPWSTSDYALPGFAHKYTTKKFVSRARATCELLQTLSPEVAQNFDKAEIFDFGAGPGSAAAGVCRFLLQRNVEQPRVTLLDPVKEWEPATRAFREMWGIDAEFELSPTLKDMLGSFKERVTSSQGPFVICLSHVLIDFLEEEERPGWWAELKKICDKRQAIVLVLEREDSRRWEPCEGATCWKLPADSDDQSYCAHFFFNVRRRLAPMSAEEVPSAANAGAVNRHLHAPPQQDFTIPNCPRHRIPMEFKRNSKDGSHFWGCSKFREWPRCKETRPA